MFIVARVEKDPSPIGAKCQYYASNGAWSIIGNGGYKHFVPTELMMPVNVTRFGSKSFC
jgi:hypothetical protein